MERLTAFDASLLYAETSSVPLHVCSIAELDTTTIPGGYDFDRIRDHLASRMSALPELRAKLANSHLNLDHPVWVEDTELDVSQHLHRIALPAPGGRHELSEVCGRIASIPLDRDKPLWEMWVIEGVGGTDPHDGGPIALMIKVHHAAVDGVSAGDLLNQLCDLQPDAPPPDAVAGPGGALPLEIEAGGLLRFLTRPWQLTRAVPATVSTVASTIGRALSGRAMAAPFKAPATVFNAEITGDRTLALAQLDLDDVKRVKDRHGVKVNDVVMALCAGALRGYLEGRGELPDKPLVAVVPSSVREAWDRPGRNQLSGMFCNLKTHIADPVQRLLAIAESSSRAKEHSAEIAPTLLADVTQALPPPMFGVAFEVMSRTPLKRTPIHNVVMSNVAGPQAQLYVMGAELKSLYPLGPIFHGSGLNITVMSLNGKLNVGIISCRQLVDDLWDLADRFETELDALVSAEIRGAPST
ncbi:WS/DGAT/MGAT family O-acyltransferase [Mycolicibacterium elephantis]|uniref:Diacylglycerol O-acyltransferase n=1 Tax=Mycolicibacterium elephantis DSM 44368 TaxID=1335622 RepID=A0A439DV47_9MYCO|nr:wax ester/triacylglycerol synthase family O-acyltransferase [Mycolicibacterium elephantis]MCV7220800.1 wax ester/triacylglycerol synthase family O-acyltransferase [Mycolicibacterium elephantis]RWA20911.1 diacylglycerol O-acyltransferase [Mycolicibacterium elephantis DSM 44368]